MRYGKIILLFIAVAVTSNVLTVWALPWIVNQVVLHRITEGALAKARILAQSNDPEVSERARTVLARKGLNVALMAPPADAKTRTVVRPSPDLLYTACVFDLSRHALRIEAPVQNSYVSISGFGPFTANFFAIDGISQKPDAEGQRKFDLVLTHGSIADIPPGATVIRAPSSTGLVLFRSLIPRKEDLAKLRRVFQAHQTCTPL